jgi:hypothetical protein
MYKKRVKIMEKDLPKHFDGKEAIKHVTENYAKGVIASSEIHGTEIPGALSAGADAAKESAVAFLLIWTTLTALQLPFQSITVTLISFSIAWIFWKAGRSAFLGWSRLERLHRIAAQEKWEIEHNRSQEREELTALYMAKGFEGKLLTDVIDVLMSDGDLLLRVMLEEELGLSLEVHEHPLKQAFGAFLGAFLSLLTCGLCFYLSPGSGPLFASVLLVTLSSYIAAIYEKNDLIHAIVWNLGILNVSFGIVYFLMQYLHL